jgi:C4-dicarboxylate transporter DctM subunit
MGLLLIVVFTLLVLAGMPIAFALGGSAASAFLLDPGLPVTVVAQKLVGGINSFPMLAVPLFILAGSIMDIGGISERLVRLAHCLVGHLPGGLGQVVVVSELLFSGVSGSTSADTAAVGGVMIPQLTAAGYDRPRAAAITAAACAIGILVPPAIVMVVYGVIANVSIGRLFVAGVVPALLMAAGLMAQIAWQARRHGWPRARRASWRETAGAAVRALAPLSMIVVILGGIRVGLFTPTEAAAVAVLYSLLLAAAYRALSWQRLEDRLVETAVLTGTVLLAVGTAHLLSWVMAVSEISQTLADRLGAIGGGPLPFLLLTVLVFLVLGAILEGVPAVVLLTPVLLPVARKLGVDPVHYGTLVVATQGISVFLPPVGVSMFVACSVGGVTPAEIARPLAPYLGLMLLLTFVLVLFPETVLFLPRVMGY